MTPSSFAVWEWLDKDGTPMYVGRGRILDGVHPAQALWNQRTKAELDSHLMRWLRTFEEEPQRSDAVPELTIYQQEADGWFYARRAQLKERGVDLLSTRPFGTTVGGGTSRAVVSPEGDVYTSVREAVRDTGLSVATIIRFCKSPRSDWKYVDEISD